MSEDYLERIEQKEGVAIKLWWDSLDDNRGDRAQLRRARYPEELLLREAFYTFTKKMPERWRTRDGLMRSALVAGVLSHVTKNPEIKIAQGGGPKRRARFAEQLAMPQDSGRSAMSKLRFDKLQKSRSLDDFYRNTLRAINLLDKSVNLVPLADSLVHWYDEFTSKNYIKPKNRVAVVWASDYFTVLDQYKLL